MSRLLTTIKRNAADLWESTIAVWAKGAQICRAQGLIAVNALLVGLCAALLFFNSVFHAGLPVAAMVSAMLVSLINLVWQELQHESQATETWYADYDNLGETFDGSQASIQHAKRLCELQTLVTHLEVLDHADAGRTPAGLMKAYACEATQGANPIRQAFALPDVEDDFLPDLCKPYRASERERSAVPEPAAVMGEAVAYGAMHPDFTYIGAGYA